MNRQTAFCLAALAIGIVLVVSSFWNTTTEAPFHYDESDYMYAGRQGLLANYLDRPSLSLVEFVQKGIELSRDRSKGDTMSRLVREMGDITFYRHYHGPVYAYWIGLCQLVGVEKEGTFRASGLLLHSLTALTVLLLFRRIFGLLPAWSALLAAFAYLLNRTGLVAAGLVTQHVIFPIWTALTLFLVAQFRRDLDRRYWYGAAAMLGVGFATLESSFILAGAMLLSLITLYGRLPVREMVRLTAVGAGVCAGALLVVWPKGVLQLGLPKGYLYLGYMALVKKTFTPISALDLWKHKLASYPYEYVLPLVAMTAGVVFYRKLACRDQAAPFLIYSWLFVIVTMIITLPYTYYHTTLLMSAAVVIGLMAGELWMRYRLAGGVAAGLAGLSLVAMAVIYHDEAASSKRNSQDHRAEVIEYIRAAGPGKTYYVPFVLIPPLHYYAPQIRTAPVDAAWSGETIAKVLSAPGEAKELICLSTQCEQVVAALGLPGDRLRRKPIAPAGELLNEPIYSLAIEPGSSQ